MNITESSHHGGTSTALFVVCLTALAIATGCNSDISSGDSDTGPIREKPGTTSGNTSGSDSGTSTNGRDTTNGSDTTSDASSDGTTPEDADTTVTDAADTDGEDEDVGADTGETGEDAEDSGSSDSSVRDADTVSPADGSDADTADPDTAAPVPVGASCSSTADCGGHQDAFCNTSKHYKDGHCTLLNCGPAGNSCPSGSHCLETDGGLFKCVRSCSSSCSRDGYACYDADRDSQNECYPAGTGSTDMGEVCTQTADCSSGPWAFCWGQQTSSREGMCSELCGSGKGSCENGTVCASFSSLNNSFCVPSCSSDADCLNGWQCQSNVCTP